jgi:hypothetical protein
MNKNPKVTYKDAANPWNGNINDPLEEERYAQLQEHRRKQQKECMGLSENKRRHITEKKPKPRGTGLESSLEKTWKWLSETFPFLFGTNATRPLDTHIIRDIKDHHKRYQAQNRYPKDLVIKAALYRYMEKPEYLHCLQEGAFRYDIHGTPVEAVTKAEEEKALQLLKQI